MKTNPTCLSREPKNANKTATAFTHKQWKPKIAEIKKNTKNLWHKPNINTNNKKKMKRRPKNMLERHGNNIYLLYKNFSTK